MLQRILAGLTECEFRYKTCMQARKHINSGGTVSCNSQKEALHFVLFVTSFVISSGPPCWIVVHGQVPLEKNLCDKKL